MGIDITTIIITVISSIVGSGTIAGVVTFIIFRKQNKAIKDQEVVTSKLENELKKAQLEQTKIANDKDQIDLGNMYLEKVQQISEMMISTNNDRSNFEKKWSRKMEELTTKMDYCCSEIGSMSDYLNGGYKEYKKAAGEIITKPKIGSKTKNSK